MYVMPEKDSAAGFTLYEMAIVLLIVGLILSGAIAIALPVMREARITGTQGKIDKIARAIDFYATHNYRVPCPAVPNLATASPSFGYEAGSTPSNGDTVPTACKQTSGIVPFRTLGIPIDLARDAWGNYITYAISPAFSLDTSDDTIPVHARCRTADWYASPMTYEQGGTVNAVYSARNARKARFCCPYPASFPPSKDLTIVDGNGNNQLVNSRASGLAAETSPGAGATTDVASKPYYIDAATYQIHTNAILDNNNRPTAPVYVLVSHGANGLGTWNVNTGARNPSTGATAGETKNSLDTGTYVEIPKLDRASGEKGYDDVLLWRTQDLIFASQGQSCAAP